MADRTQRDLSATIVKRLIRFSLCFKQSKLEGRFRLQSLELLRSRLLIFSFAWSMISIVLWLGVSRHFIIFPPSSTDDKLSAEIFSPSVPEKVVLRFFFCSVLIWCVLIVSVSFISFTKPRLESLFFVLLVSVEILVTLWNNVQTYRGPAASSLLNNQTNGGICDILINNIRISIVCLIFRLTEIIGCTLIVPARCRFAFYFICFVLLNNLLSLILRLLLLVQRHPSYRRPLEIFIQIASFLLISAIGASCFLWRYIVELNDRKTFYQILSSEPTNETKHCETPLQHCIESTLSRLERVKLRLADGCSAETMMMVISIVQKCIKVLRRINQELPYAGCASNDVLFQEIMTQNESGDICEADNNNILHNYVKQLICDTALTSLYKEKSSSLARTKAMSLYFMDTDIKGHQLKRRSRPTFFETHCSRTSKEKRGKSYSKQKLELLQKLIAESCDSILLQPQAFSDEKLMKLLDGVGQKWDLNLLQIEQYFPNPIILIGQILLKSLSSPLVNEEVFLDFLSRLSQLYNPNPYHNGIHASMVAHSTMCLASSLGIRNSWDGLEMLSLIIAALGHDAAHQGRTNSYYIKTMDPLAILYNDESPLENMHASLIIQLIQERENFFPTFCQSYVSTYSFRRNIIEFILATDMKEHFETLSSVRIRKNAEDFNFLTVVNDFCLIGKLCLKAADLCHGAIEWSQHLELSLRVCEEFYQQGDEERKLGLAVLPLYDRTYHSQFQKSQRSFLTLIVLPLFQELQSLYELKYKKSKRKKRKRKKSLGDHCCDQIKLNLLKWKSINPEEFAIPQNILNTRSNTFPAYTSMYYALRAWHEKDLYHANYSTKDV